MKSQRLTLALRLEVCERDGWWCRRCGTSCLYADHSIHHRLPRRMGGTRDPRSNDLRNLVLVCGSGTTGCHGWIESNRTEAYAQGWLLRSYDDLDVPMGVPA